MPCLMADNDVQGHLEILIRICNSPKWLEVWGSLHVAIESFESMGLLRHVPDRELWQQCQLRRIVLLTGNRNRRGAMSLESTIELFGSDDSLPVLTFANPQRVINDPAHAEDVAIRLMEYLMNIDQFCGTGRLYLP